MGRYFNIKEFKYQEYKKYSFPSERKYQSKESHESEVYPPFNNVDIAFLAGGTFRIPFLQNQVKDMFPNAEIIIDGQLEIITATGAALHALQVLSREVEPYVKIIGQENNEFDYNNKQNQSVVESDIKIHGERERDSSGNSNLDEKASASHDQNATTSTSEVDNSINEHQQKIIPEISEETSLEKKSLPP